MGAQPILLGLGEEKETIRLICRLSLPGSVSQSNFIMLNLS